MPVSSQKTCSWDCAHAWIGKLWMNYWANNHFVWPLSVSPTGRVHELQITKVLGLGLVLVTLPLLLQRLILTSDGLCPVSRFACAHGWNQPRPWPRPWPFRLHVQDVGGDRSDLLLLCDGNSLHSDHIQKKTSPSSASSWGKGHKHIRILFVFLKNNVSK